MQRRWLEKPFPIWRKRTVCPYIPILEKAIYPPEKYIYPAVFGRYCLILSMQTEQIMITAIHIAIIKRSCKNSSFLLCIFSFEIGNRLSVAVKTLTFDGFFTVQPGVGVPAKFLTGIYIGDVHFNRRNCHRFQCIEDGD